MLCCSPLTVAGLPVGCGQCLHCRINRRRLWTVRLLLEAQSHDTASFVTLTYEVEPEGRSLVRRDLSLFLKRLRDLLVPVPVRFFACGEYGDQMGRPHYHLVIYSLAPTPVTEEVLVRAWRAGEEWSQVPQKPGFVCLRPFDAGRAAYVAGYVVAKLKGPLDSKRLQGRLPEFAVMSRRPGLGREAAKDVARALSGPAGRSLVEKSGDVPSILRSGSTLWVLDRYIKAVVRDELEVEAVPFHVEELRRAVQLVRAKSLAHRRNPGWFLSDHSTAEAKEWRLRSFGKRGVL